jgi:hypothetical protein
MMILSAGGIQSLGDVGNRIGINPVRDIEEHFRLVQSAREFCYRREVIVRSDGFDTGILHDLIGSRELAHFPQQSVVSVEGHRDQQGHQLRLVQQMSERNKTIWSDSLGWKTRRHALSCD